MFDAQGHRKYVNRLERQAYFQTILNEPNEARRAFGLTLFYTGCRISEALNVTTERVDLSDKTIVFETLKQRKVRCYRAVPIPDVLVTLLRRLLTQFPPSARVWQFSRSTGYRLIKAKMKQAAVSGKMACPKGLRHGHGVACVSGKIPLTTIKKWLGHARLETTAIYLEVTGEEERELAARLWSADRKEN